MHITIVTEFFPSSPQCNIKGGVEARAFFIARNLVRRGHRVTVLAFHQKGAPRKQTIDGIEVIRCGPEVPYSLRRSYFAILSFLVHTIRLSWSLKVDLVDGYNFIAYLSAYFLSRILGIPRVVTYHDVWLGEWIKNVGLFPGIIGSLVERFVLSVKWNKLIAVSTHTKEKLIRAGIDQKKIEVVYNGVDLALFNRIECPKEPGTICYVGRLVKYKRVDDLIKAIRILHDRNKKVKLKIIGSGPERNNLQNLTTKLNLSDYVKFLGFLDNYTEVISHLKNSYLFSLPSKVEGFGMVTIESAAAGTPYINSAIPATIEITRNGLGGLLFNPEDIEDLATKLEILLEDKDLYLQKQKEALELSQDFDWKKISDNIEKVYAEILK